MVRNVAPRDAQELIAKGEIDVIDVREPHEWATGHVPGARLVSLGQLEVSAVGKRALFICEKGGRSAKAASLADAAGIEAFSLEGGTSGWRTEGLPIVMPEKPTASEETTELDAIVGENLKRLRADRQWTLDVLAGMTGVGRQTLGQIELGRTVPSLGTLWKIATALGVPFSTLIARPSDNATRIFRRTTAPKIEDADGRFSSRALFSPHDKGSFEFYELFLAARSREDAEPHAPGTRENLLVTQGTLVLELGSERFELSKGDAIAFTADVKHAYVNPASGECWMSLVMTYPRLA
jgi:rhodanese-related sulfurtransferase/transcriptional regulator with XRE-family HTH domain